MEWDKLKISRPDAICLFHKYKSSGQFGYNNDFKDLREELLSLWKNSKSNEDGDGYFRDLRFAINLYDLLTQKGFTQWEAADDEIWAGFALKVIPDIFYERWPYDVSKDDHAQRWIFRRTWRVWTKTLWWFIYLTMATDDNGNLDKEKTWNRLCHLEATSIDDFLDRCGMGFRVDFCRKFMEHYAKYAQDNNITGTKRRKTFRFAVSQAYLRAGNIDPDLCGHDTFLDDIFAMLKKD